MCVQHGTFWLLFLCNFCCSSSSLLFLVVSEVGLSGPLLVLQPAPPSRHAAAVLTGLYLQCHACMR